MRITGSVVAACALIAVACNRAEPSADAHQQPNTPKTERPAGEPRRDNSTHPTMHITGCIEPGVIAGTFMLTQVDVAGTDAGAGSTIPGGSPGTSGQADDRAMAGERADAHTAPAVTYTVRSLERGTDLRKYVGQRVAVIGRLTADRDQTGLGTRGTSGRESSPGAGQETTRSDRPGGTAAAGPVAAAANIRQLDADSIRTVAGTCTPAGGAR
jgi:hypothetical protein